ncbi:MAG: hypothetical protein ACFWTS_08945 [Pseudoclavibacter caeni]|jgi:hypothetical protein
MHPLLGPTERGLDDPLDRARRERPRQVAHERDGEHPRRAARRPLGGHRVQQRRVLAHERRGAGQRRGEPRAELPLEQRQHAVAHPHPGESGVVILRVVPDRDAPGPARRPGDAAAQAQQRSDDPPGHGAHPADRPGPGPTGEAEQHRLRLVIEGVREQDEIGALRAPGPFQRGQARPPGRRLHAAGPGDPHPLDGGRVGAERGAAPGCRRGDRGAASLQTVVDGERPPADAEPGGHVRDRGGQGQRVGAAADTHEHTARAQRRETLAHRVTHRRRGGVERRTTLGHVH